MSWRVENRSFPRKLSEITDGVADHGTASVSTRSRRSSLKNESCLPDRPVRRAREFYRVRFN